MIIAVACDLEKNGKYYPHIFYMNMRIMYENVTAHTKKYFQKELALIKQVYQKKCMLCRYWCFKDNGFKVKPHVSNQDKRSKSYLFVSGKEIIKFKSKHSEILATPLFLGNISKHWSIDNVKKLD